MLLGKFKSTLSRLSFARDSLWYSFKQGQYATRCCLHDGVAFENYRGLVGVELPEIAPDTRATLPAPRRNVRSTPDGGSAVQPPGLSYTAQWEALGCAPRLLTTPEISSTGPVRGRGFCPGSHRPRARVPLVVWPGTFCYAGSLPGSPAPCSKLSVPLRYATVCQKLDASLRRNPALVK
jgi:hypothetical protein